MRGQIQAHRYDVRERVRLRRTAFLYVNGTLGINVSVLTNANFGAAAPSECGRHADATSSRFRRSEVVERVCERAGERRSIRSDNEADGVCRFSAIKGTRKRHRPQHAYPLN
uniref:Transposase n=1 Tax=Ascaris lumbricoides TaxID=6252 RepID=A0A0M3I3Z0_ASCLU